MSNGFGPPPNHGFGPPPQPQHPQQPHHGGFGPPMGQPVQPVPINADIPLFVGIVVAMFCGCLPGGILAIVFADQAKKAARRGDATEAQSKLKLSYITSAVSVLLLIVPVCLYFMFAFFVAGASAL